MGCSDLNPLKKAQDLIDSGGKLVSDIGGGIVKTINSAGKAVEVTVDNFVHNPLPVLETVALTYALGPEGLIDTGLGASTNAAIASASVKAANGGSLDQIALAAATSYASAQISNAAANQVSPVEQQTLQQLGPQYSDTALIKQIVTSASGPAAVAALRGGSFQQVLSAGVDGAVNGAITSQLAQEGFNQVDKQIIANATTAATKAILQGKDVGQAIGASVASTTLQAAISGKVDQINKNNELGQSLINQFNDLQPKATDYFNTYVDPAQKQELKDYNALKTVRDTYNTQLDSYNAAVKSYNTYKDASDTDNANAQAKIANDLAAKLKDTADSLQTSYDAYNKSADAANTVRTIYASDYTSKLGDINKQIVTVNQNNSTLAQDLGQDTTKAEVQAAQDQTDIVKQITANAVQNANDVIAKQSGWTDYDQLTKAKQEGFTDSNTYSLATKGGFTDAATYNQATSAGFTDLKTYDTATKAGFTDAATYGTATKYGYDTLDAWKQANVKAQEAGWNDVVQQTTATAAGFTQPTEVALAYSQIVDAFSNPTTPPTGGVFAAESGLDAGATNPTSFWDSFTLGNLTSSNAKNIFNPVQPTTVPTTGTTPTTPTTTTTTTPTTAAIETPYTPYVPPVIRAAPKFDIKDLEIAGIPAQELAAEEMLLNPNALTTLAPQDAQRVTYLSPEEGESTTMAATGGSVDDLLRLMDWRV